MNDSLKVLGKSPSMVLRSEAAAPILETGYQVTDFAGLFTVPKAQFLVATGTPRRAAISEGIEIKSAGALSLRSGTLAVSDPSDSTWFDRTVLPVAAPLPAGKHEVYLAEQYDEVIAVVVVFAGETEVAGWLPALLGEAPEPMPTPPMFPMPPVRFSLGLADAELMGKIGPDGKHPALEKIRRDLARPKPGKLWSSHGGLVAFSCDRAPVVWLGFDAAGAPRALAFDFGRLRRWDEDPLVSAPGLLLDVGSLSARFRAVRPYKEADATVLARALLARIRACKKAVWKLEPNEAEAELFEMPIGLLSASLKIRIAKAAEVPPKPAKPVLDRDGLLARSLAELEISIRITNALQKLGLETVADLVALTEAKVLSAMKKELRDQRRAERSVREIKELLAEDGLALRD